MDIERKASFEENFTSLERVVAALDRGDLALEEAIALFEQGMRFAKACNDQLEAAELKISQLRAGLLTHGFGEEG